jgi:hypothetical protein
MSRRADPERIYQARRAATFSRLTQAERLDPLDAEHLISAWERSEQAKSLDRFTQAYWEEADRWIAEQQVE